eukprot:22508-Eustigmatos_ZCMA.PRE.1
MSQTHEKLVPKAVHVPSERDALLQSIQELVFSPQQPVWVFNGESWCRGTTMNAAQEGDKKTN